MSDFFNELKRRAEQEYGQPEKRIRRRAEPTNEPEQEPEVMFTPIKIRRRVATGRPDKCLRGPAANACRRVAVQAATIPSEMVPAGHRAIRVTCCDRRGCMADAKTVALAQYTSRAGYRMLEAKTKTA